jgi:ornithine decarboxylase
MVPYTIAGLSCDSVDTMFKKDYMLPRDLALGDKLYIMNAGVYTLSCASNFNGMEPPKVVFMSEE